MPLQNRVTPSGDIVATPQRGLFTGNRGIIHDPATKTLLRKRWSSSAWITCLCEFRGHHREVMATRSWTELFFLDEATALAAGHRPCFFCRRADALAFQAAWQQGNGVSRASAKAIDAVLHRERLDGKAKRLHPLPGAIADLPDGAMVQARTPDDCNTRNAPAFSYYLILQGRALLWSFDGYRAIVTAPREPQLLTPPSTLRALDAGYQPRLHPSADAN
jgi:hypothetical protein